MGSRASPELRSCRRLHQAPALRSGSPPSGGLPCARKVPRSAASTSAMSVQSMPQAPSCTRTGRLVGVGGTVSLRWQKEVFPLRRAAPIQAPGLRLATQAADQQALAEGAGPALQHQNEYHFGIRRRVSSSWICCLLPRRISLVRAVVVGVSVTERQSNSQLLGFARNCLVCRTAMNDGSSTHLFSSKNKCRRKGKRSEEVSTAHPTFSKLATCYFRGIGHTRL